VQKNWFENLKSLFHLDLGSVKSVTIKLFSDNTGGLVNVDRSKTVNINVAPEVLKNSNDRQRLQAIIRAATLEETDRPLLEIQASEDIEVIAALENRNDTLHYFTNKIPDADLPILKAALFIKNNTIGGNLYHVTNKTF
jgi:hypothetical protein